MSRSPSPVAFRRQQAGFVPATRRERCANCAHVEVHSTPVNSQVVREHSFDYSCDRVGFTTAWAVCKGWESASQARKPVPNRSKTEIRPHGAETGSSAPAAGGQKEVS